MNQFKYIKMLNLRLKDKQLKNKDLEILFLDTQQCHYRH